MSHQQRHRGPNPKDVGIFSAKHVPRLQSAIQDYCWLLSKGYACKSSLKIVGDKFLLTERQRLALMRSACSEAQRENRIRKELLPETLDGHALYLDGLNVLITIESAIAGGFIFIGVDGCYRDLSSIHGTYKRVHETQDAILMIGRALDLLKIPTTHWLLDQPVSNSGRLKAILEELATEHGWNWDVKLCKSPDAELKQLNRYTVTTDSVILDSVDSWFNLNKFVISRFVPEFNGIRLCGWPDV